MNRASTTTLPPHLALVCGPGLSDVAPQMSQYPSISVKANVTQVTDTVKPKVHVEKAEHSLLPRLTPAPLHDSERP